MEPVNQEPISNVPSQPITPINNQFIPSFTSPTQTTMPEQKEVFIQAPKSNKLIWVIVGIVALIVLIVGGFFAYQKVYVPFKEKQKQELLKQQELQKYQEISSRIGKEDIYGLTREDYLVYLNHKIDYTPWLAKEDYTNFSIGAFNLSLDKEWEGNIKVLGPETLFGDSYIILDSVDTKNGPEDITQNNFEDQDKDIFHEVDNYEKVETSLGTYYRGDRKLHTNSEIKDITKIVGKIVLPFYDNTEKVVLLKGDTEKLTKFGKISKIIFDQNNFQADFSGDSNLISMTAYDQKNVLLSKDLWRVNDQISGQYDNEPYKVELIFGIESKDIEIPFIWEINKKENIPIKAEIVTENQNDESTWITISDQNEIMKLQKGVGEFAMLFQKGDVERVKEYTKIGELYDEEYYKDRTDAEIKEELKILATSVLSITEQKLASSEDIIYKKLENTKEWSVSNVPTKDPFFNEDINITFILKEIDGKIYVVDFTVE